MSARVYQLPDLLALFPEKPGGSISPHFKDAEAGYNRWVKEKLGWLFSIVRVSNAEMPLLAALAWPLASCKELRAILDYMTASFMLEEMTDRYSSATALRNSQIWIKTLRDPDAGKGIRHPFIKTMSTEMVSRMKDAITPFHWPQFIDSNEKFSENTVREALDREAFRDVRATHNIQAYMVMRRETIGARPCFVLMRSTRGLEIPDHVLKHPVVEEMENVALDMVYIANDIYSFKKELGDNGALNNLLTIIHKDPTTNHLDLQERIDCAGKLFKSSLNRFHAGRRTLPLFQDEFLNQQISAYADGLLDWIVGNIEWSIINHRYNTFASELERKNNLMRLNRSPRWLSILYFPVLSVLVIVMLWYFTS
ncbi:isoprenoid synthase domain-containing protein [Phlebopus sp. FC_14]|nr:isoprenoid synthase domain-containing protein [Phlebopus sp. FC_14]